MNIDVLVGALFGAGSPPLLAGIWRVIQSYRSDKATSEDTLIERLDARLKAAEKDSETFREERDTERERATRYRLLAIELGATTEQLARAANG